MYFMRIGQKIGRVITAPHCMWLQVELPMPLLLEAVLEAGAKEESMDQRWNHMKDMVGR